MGWAVDPRGLTDLLLRCPGSARTCELMVTENGAAYDDYVGAEGVVHDPERIDYLRGHLAAVHAAIGAGREVTRLLPVVAAGQLRVGVRVRKRFGIVHVDYATLERTPKASARFYAQVVKENAVPVR